MNAVTKVLVPATSIVAMAAGASILAQPPAAPGQAGFTITVAETAGMRRNEFPVRATIALPQRALAGPDAAVHIKLAQADAEVPAQYTVMSRWPDESAKTVDVDFNASLAPGETRMYRLEYGADVTSAQRPRGLAVTDSADAIQIGNIKFNKSGSPLIASANYRGEFIAQGGQGTNGFAILDADNTRHDLSTARDLKVEIVKRGPLVAALQYTGQLPVDASYAVPFVLTLEMPNSKSWLKSSVEITDRSGRARALRFDTPFALGAYPWLWDVATANDAYGAFRTAQDAAVFTQVIEPGGTGRGAGGRGAPNAGSQWKVETTAQGQLRPYETSTAASSVSDGWGHFQGPSLAVAFGIERFRTSPGTFTVSLNGQGQASWQYAPARRTPPPADAAVQRLTLYQHFVATPVPIGAATSPSSMLQGPTVTVTAIK